MRLLSHETKKNKGGKMAKRGRPKKMITDAQLSFSNEQLLNKGPIQDALFTRQTLINAKINFLVERLHILTFADITWLERMETFYKNYDYLTEKQIGILHNMVSRIESGHANAINNKVELNS